MEGRTKEGNEIVFVPERVGRKKFLRSGSRRQVPVIPWRIKLDKINSTAISQHEEKPSSTKRKEKKKKNANARQEETSRGDRKETSRDDHKENHVQEEQGADKQSDEKTDRAPLPPSSDRENTSPNSGRKSALIRRTPRKSLNEIAASLLRRASPEGHDAAVETADGGVSPSTQHNVEERSGKSPSVEHRAIVLDTDEMGGGDDHGQRPAQLPELSNSLKNLSPQRNVLASPLVRSTRRKTSLVQSKDRRSRPGSRLYSRGNGGCDGQEGAGQPPSSGDLQKSPGGTVDSVVDPQGHGGVPQKPQGGRERVPSNSRKEHDQTEGIPVGKNTRRKSKSSVPRVPGPMENTDRTVVRSPPGHVSTSEEKGSPTSHRLQRLQQTLGGMTPLDWSEKYLTAEKRPGATASKEDHSVPLDSSSVKNKSSKDTNRGRLSKGPSAKKSGKSKSGDGDRRDKNISHSRTEANRNVARSVNGVKDVEGSVAGGMDSGRERSRVGRDGDDVERQSPLRSPDGDADGHTTPQSSRRGERTSSREPRAGRGSRGRGSNQSESESPERHQRAVGRGVARAKVRAGATASLQVKAGIRKDKQRPAQSDESEGHMSEERTRQMDSSRSGQGVEMEEGSPHGRLASDDEVSNRNEDSDGSGSEDDRQLDQNSVDKRGAKTKNLTRSKGVERSSRTGKTKSSRTQSLSRVDKTMSKEANDHLNKSSKSRKKSTLGRNSTRNGEGSEMSGEEKPDFEEVMEEEIDLGVSDDTPGKRQDIQAGSEGSSAKKRTSRRRDSYPAPEEVADPDESRRRTGDGPNHSVTDPQGDKKLERLQKQLGGMTPLERTLDLLAQSRAELRETMPSLMSPELSRIRKKPVTPSDKPSSSNRIGSTKKARAGPPKPSKGKGIMNKKSKAKNSANKVKATPPVKLVGRRKGAKKGTWPPKTPRMVLDSDVEDGGNVTPHSTASESDMGEAHSSRVSIVDKKRTVNDLCDLDVIMECTWEEAQAIRSGLPNKRLKTAHDAIISSTTGDLLELIRSHSQLKTVMASGRNTKREVTKKRSELLELQQQQRNLSRRLSKLKRRKEGATATDPASLDQDSTKFLASLRLLYREAGKANGPPSRE